MNVNNLGGTTAREQITSYQANRTTNNNNNQRSVTDQLTTKIRSVGELETLLKGGHSGQVIDMRTSNITPEVWAALSRGEEVEVALQQMAPERVNLFMPLVASVMQLIGGAQGASYNDALSEAIKGGVNKAGEFVSKHGMSYSLNPFGGGQHIDVQAQFKILNPPRDEQPPAQTTPPTQTTPPATPRPRTNNTTRIPPREEPPVRDIKTEIADILDSKEFKLLKTEGGYGTLFSFEEAAKSANMSVDQLKSMLTNAGIDINTLTNKELYAVSFLQRYQPKHDDIVTNDGIGKLKGTYKDTTSGNTINSAVIMELDTPSSYVNSGKENTIAKGRAVRDYVMTAMTSTEAFDKGLGFPSGIAALGNTVSPIKIAQAESVFSKYSPINSPKALLDMADKFAAEGKLDKAGEIYSALFLQVENNARGNDGKGVSNGHLGAGHYGALQEAVIDRANIFVDGSRALNTVFNGGNVANLDPEEKKGLEDLIKLHKELKGSNIDINNITPEQAKALLQFSKENLSAIKENLESTGLKDAHPNLKALVGMIPNIIGSSEIKDGKGSGINALLTKLDTPSSTAPSNNSNQAFNLASSLSDVVSEINSVVTSTANPKPTLNLTEASKQALIKAGVTEEEISKMQSGDNTAIKSSLSKIESKLVEIKTSLPPEDASKIDELLGKKGENNSGVRGLIDILETQNASTTTTTSGDTNTVPSNAVTGTNVNTNTPPSNTVTESNGDRSNTVTSNAVTTNTIIPVPSDNNMTPIQKGEKYVGTLLSNINEAIEIALKDNSSKIKGFTPLEYAKKVEDEFIDFMSKNPTSITAQQKDDISKALINLRAQSGAFTDVARANAHIDNGISAPTSRPSNPRLKELLDAKGISLEELQKDGKLDSFKKDNPAAFKLLSRDFNSMSKTDMIEAVKFFGIGKTEEEGLEMLQNIQAGAKRRDGLRSVRDSALAAVSDYGQGLATRGNPDGIKARIGRKIEEYTNAVKNSEAGSPQNILATQRLNEYMSLIENANLKPGDRDSFISFRAKVQEFNKKYEELFKQLPNVVNRNGEINQTTADNIVAHAPQEIREDLSNALHTMSAADAEEVRSSNVSGSAAEPLPSISEMSSSEVESLLDFSVEDKPKPELISNLNNVQKYNKEALNVRSMLKTVEGTSELFKMMNAEFSKQIQSIQTQSMIESESTQNAGESSSTTDEALAASANDMIEEANKLEGMIEAVDQFDPNAASIDKLLSDLRDIITNLEEEIVKVISLVRKKQKQDKKSETHSFDEQSTRKLLNELKSQLKETHNKSPEELRAISGNRDELVKQLKEAKKILGDDTIYAINYRPERLSPLALA